MSDQYLQLAASLVAALQARLPLIDIEGLTPKVAYALRSEEDRGNVVNLRQAALLARVWNCPWSRRPVARAYRAASRSRQRE